MKYLLDGEETERLLFRKIHLSDFNQWLLLGEVEELWDMVALAEYPSLAAMQQMVQSSVGKIYAGSGRYECVDPQTNKCIGGA